MKNNSLYIAAKMLGLKDDLGNTSISKLDSSLVDRIMSFHILLEETTSESVTDNDIAHIVHRWLYDTQSKKEK